MSQRVVTPEINTNIPGAYPVATVKSNPVGLGASGNIVIIGEADGGDSYENVSLKDNSFTPDQFDKVQAKYLSGPIVDAMSALTSPSADSNIVGSANRVFIVKTNSGDKAEAAVDTDYGTLSDKNWGVSGNQLKFQVTQIAAESAPTKTSNTVPAFGAALNGAEFQIRQDGKGVATITLSATASDHNSASTLAAEIQAAFTAASTLTGMTCVASGTTAIVIAYSADAGANRKGFGKSFQLIDSSADLASLGLTAGLVVSAQEPGVEVAISRPSTGLNETKDIAAAIALEIGYLGTTATLTIASGSLSTTVTGGAGAGLTIALADYRTIADLATFIAAQPGYSASASAAAQQAPTSSLDAVSAIGIASSVAGVKPGRVKSAANAFQKAMATSKATDFAPIAAAGLPAPGVAAFLSGGAKGSTAAADIVAAVQQLAGIQVNVVVPLFSRDATTDIAEGLTDSASTYTIDAIHAAVKNHCLAYSTPELKRNRIAVLSFWGSYAQAKTKSQSLATYRCSMTMQKVTQLSSSGAIVNFLPWYGAVVAAGMQAGGFYKAIVNKLANVIAFEDPTGYDSGSPGDVEDALDAGLLILTKDNAGNKWVSDQTTYGFDTNFVYNSLQAVYLADILVLDLADSFQKAFVGQSLADVDAATALSFLYQKMDGYKKLKMIASSDDAPLGFKNAKVSISAPTMSVSVEIKLATAIYFIPINIAISAVQQAA